MAHSEHFYRLGVATASLSAPLSRLFMAKFSHSLASQSSQISMDSATARFVCDSCFSVLIPSVSSKVTIKPLATKKTGKRKGKGKSTNHPVQRETLCLHCGRKKREIAVSRPRFAAKTQRTPSARKKRIKMKEEKQKERELELMQGARTGGTGTGLIPLLNLSLKADERKTAGLASPAPSKPGTAPRQEPLSRTLAFASSSPLGAAKAASATTPARPASTPGRGGGNGGVVGSAVKQNVSQAGAGKRPAPGTNAGRNDKEKRKPGQLAGSDEQPQSGLMAFLASL